MRKRSLDSARLVLLLTVHGLAEDPPARTHACACAYIYKQLVAALGHIICGYRSAASTGIAASSRAPAEEDFVALSVKEECGQLELVSLRGGPIENIESFD